MPLNVLDGASASKYVKGTGAASSGDPFIPEHLESNSAAIKTDLDSIATNTSTDATNTTNLNTAIGTQADAAVTGNGTLIAIVKQLRVLLSAALAVTQSGTWTVQPGNTANTTAWKVDGSAVTQPVSGTVSITSNSAVNVAQVAGTTTDTNSGNKSAGTQRFVIATDQPALTNALKVDGSAVTQPISVALPATIYNGNKNVTTAGTRVTLASSQAISSGVTIKAKAANTGTIYVGDTSVSSANGFALAAGDTIFLEVANLNTVNLDASVSGEGVTYIST